MEEVQRLYNLVIEGININCVEDQILRMNDILSVYKLLITKTFQLEKDDKKRVLIIDSIKAMNNQLVSDVMKIVTENEMKTIDNE